MSTFYQDKNITIKESEYNQMCEYLNSFAELVEKQREEIEDLKSKLQASKPTDIQEKLKKYQSVLNGCGVKPIAII